MGVKNKRTLTKTRRKTRDIDQTYRDLRQPSYLREHLSTKAPEDLPGLGRHYCVECARWFESEATLKVHRKGGPHRRRIKALREEPYTQKEAEAAVGLRTDKGMGEENKMDVSE